MNDNDENNNIHNDETIETDSDALRELNEALERHKQIADKNHHRRNSAENDEKGKIRPLSAYAIASQVGFTVIFPLLLFIGGGWWLTRKLSLPEWVMAIFVLLGILTMIASLVTYLYKIIRMFGGANNVKKKKDNDNNLRYLSDDRDNDYYDRYN